MSKDIAALVVGYCALFCSATYRIPQFLKIYRGKSVAGISQQQYVWQNMSYVLSIAYGVLRDDTVYIVTSVTLLAMNIALQCMVRYYRATTTAHQNTTTAHQNTTTLQNTAAV